jgi:hypothetical protein
MLLDFPDQTQTPVTILSGEIHLRLLACLNAGKRVYFNSLLLASSIPHHRSWPHVFSIGVAVDPER